MLAVTAVFWHLSTWRLQLQPVPMADPEAEPDRVCLFTVSAFNNYGLVRALLKRAEALHPKMNVFWVLGDNHRPLEWATAPHRKLEQLHLQILRDFPRRWHLVTLDQLQPQMPFSYAEIAFRYPNAMLQHCYKACCLQTSISCAEVSKGALPGQRYLAHAAAYSGH